MFQGWSQGVLSNDPFKMNSDPFNSDPFNSDPFKMNSDPFNRTDYDDFEDCLKFLKQKQPSNTQIQTTQPNLNKQSWNNNSIQETNFEDEINIILINEGGYSNRKDDRGGETNRGITQTTYTNFQKKYPNILKFKSVKDLELTEVKEFYKVYLKDCKANLITNKSNRIQFADAAVHHGGRTATILAQRTLGLQADGSFGPNTKNYINNADEFQFKKLFIQERRDLCAQLILRKPNQKSNEKGWNNRFNRMENL